MLDYRYSTFLTLCNLKSYTKTAEQLHMTQPAVTQHIKFLEGQYGGKLFSYKGRVLALTERGRRLRDFALRMSADSNHLKTMLVGDSLSKRQLNFGATLTIGEFVLPKIIRRLLIEYPDLHINMPVDNTKVLLDKLRSGGIDFALVEGFFDRAEYGYRLFSQEEYIAVSSHAHPLAGRAITLNDILDQRIILREAGSGTRDIFQSILHEFNLTIKSFERVCEIGNMSAIKRLVKEGLGITFLYKAAVEEELLQGELKELTIQNFSVSREFNLVYLKDSLHKGEYLDWCDRFINLSTLTV